MTSKFRSRFKSVRQVDNLYLAELCHLQKIRRTGSRYIACCPFHDDSTPSFGIYENGFHCFGCGWHGDGIKFLREQGYSYQEAYKIVGQC